MPIIYTHQDENFAIVEIMHDVVWSTPCKKCGGFPKPYEGWSKPCVYGVGTNNRHDQGLSPAEIKTVLTGDAARQHIANMQ